MTERVDLDALERLIHGPKLDQFSNDDLALMLDAFHELRASRKVVEAARIWARECAPGGWGEKEPEKFALYEAVEAEMAPVKPWNYRSALEEPVKP